MALGDLSVLGETIGVKHPFEKPPFGTAARKQFEKKHGKSCTAYGRDRGEAGVEARTGETLSAVWPEADTWTEFTYVWDGERWFVGNPDEGTQTLIDLGDALQGKGALQPAVKAFGAVIGQHAKTHPAKPHRWSAPRQPA